MTTPSKDNTRFFETELDDEIVQMNVETVSFHALKGASVDIWNRIDGVLSAEMIAARQSICIIVKREASGGVPLNTEFFCISVKQTVAF